MGSDYSGKKIRKNMTWKPEREMTPRQLEKELNLVAAEFEIKCRKGLVFDDNVTFYDFAEKWFTDCGQHQLRPRTFHRYKSMMPRIYAAIGHIKLKDLRPYHLISFYNNLAEEGIRLDGKCYAAIDIEKILKSKGMTKEGFAKSCNLGICTIRASCSGKHISKESAEKIADALGVSFSKSFTVVEKEDRLSNETIRYHHRVISSILSTAVQWESIESNPCLRVKPPKPSRRKPRYLDEDEAKKLLIEVENENPKYRMMTILLLLTGMRKGEALGLEWKDIDFDRSVIHIERTSQYLPQIGMFTDETKNTSSDRAIKASPSLMDEFKRYCLWQNQERLKVGDQWHDYDRLFTRWNGEPMNPQTYNHWLKDFLARKGLPDIVPHSLRHTNATLQIAHNIPLTTVAGRLGHANPSTTTKIYSHEIKSADAAAAEVLDDILIPKKTSV